MTKNLEKKEEKRQGATEARAWEGIKTVRKMGAGRKGGEGRKGERTEGERKGGSRGGREGEREGEEGVEQKVTELGDKGSSLGAFAENGLQR